MLNLALANAIILLTIFFLISWLFVAFAIYFVPVIVAHIRRHKNIAAIIVLNVFLGWTFFGWLAALLWSLNSDIQEEENE
ncbi:superinfection immunity protein [bacterium]|nr:superinfection immunity protein [bacterium]